MERKQVSSGRDLMNAVGEEIREDRERKRVSFEEKEQKLADAGYTRRRWPVHGDPKPLSTRNHYLCGQVVFSPETHDPLCPANGRGRQEPMLDGSPPP